jgi:hypothetical protein
VDAEVAAVEAARRVVRRLLQAKMQARLDMLDAPKHRTDAMPGARALRRGAVSCAASIDRVPTTLFRDVFRRGHLRPRRRLLALPAGACYARASLRLRGGQ